MRNCESDAVECLTAQLQTFQFPLQSIGSFQPIGLGSEPRGISNLFSGLRTGHGFQFQRGGLAFDHNRERRLSDPHIILCMPIQDVGIQHALLPVPDPFHIEGMGSDLGERAAMGCHMHMPMPTRRGFMRLRGIRFPTSHCPQANHHHKAEDPCSLLFHAQTLEKHCPPVQRGLLRIDSSDALMNTARFQRPRLLLLLASLVLSLVPDAQSEQVAGRAPITSRSQWGKQAESIRSAMEGIMGPIRSKSAPCPLDMQVEETTDCDSFTRLRITYQVLPRHRVPAYLLVPKGLQGARATASGVLTLHQTHPEGQKVVVGLGKSPNDEYGVELAKRGYVCLAPPYPMLAQYWPSLKELGLESGTQLGILINRRGLDLLESLPYVKKRRFGCIGHSLGGHNGLFTAAMDSRIAVVVSSCGLDSFQDYYDGDPANWKPERGWCQTRYMPRLAAYQGRLDQLPFDFQDVIAAIAPRHVFISAPLGDSNFRWKSVDKVAASARKAFELFKASDHLVVLHPDGPHQFPPEIRQRAYQEIDRVLRAR